LANTESKAREFLGLSLRYPAAALFSELRQLAQPATLDPPALDMGVGDHATAAPLTVRRTEHAVELLEGILAIEVMLARDLLCLSAREGLGGATLAALDAIARAYDDLGDSASPAEAHDRGRARLRDGFG